MVNRAVKHGKLLRCSCDHKFQNDYYGYGVRYHNPLAPVMHQPQKYRCTVCSTVRTEK